jgi:hypothetical protein
MPSYASPPSDEPPESEEKPSRYSDFFRAIFGQKEDEEGGVLSLWGEYETMMSERKQLRIL